MLRVLVDLNVVLDVLLHREPHFRASRDLWVRIEAGHAIGYLSAHHLTTLYCLARKGRGDVFARQCIVDVMSIFRVAPIHAEVLHKAIALGWSDFEDAVAAAAAIVADCNLLVTRDVHGFTGSPIRVMEPGAASILLSSM